MCGAMHGLLPVTIMLLFETSPSRVQYIENLLADRQLDETIDIYSVPPKA